MNRCMLVVAAASTIPTGLTYAQSPDGSTMMHGHSGNSMVACPMAASGAQVSAADTAAGATLTFTTSTVRDERSGGAHATARLRVHGAALTAYRGGHGSLHGGNHLAGCFLEEDAVAAFSTSGPVPYTTQLDATFLGEGAEPRLEADRRDLDRVGQVAERCGVPSAPHPVAGFQRGSK